METLESMRQPSYGKRRQLVEDGLHSAHKHVLAALDLSHPFNVQLTVKEDHRGAMSIWEPNPKDNNWSRLKTLGEWKFLAVAQAEAIRRKTLKEVSQGTMHVRSVHHSRNGG